MNTTSDKVRHVSTSTILPATQKEEKTTDQRIELNPSDLWLLRDVYAQTGLLFAKPKSGKKSNHGETNTLLTYLKSCLSKTLDYFFPLAGRLAMTKHDEDGTISFYIDCNSAGAEFVHAVAADVTVADLLEPTYTPEIINSFFTLNGVPNYEGLSLPLLSVQATELVDGIFIGCSVNHVVCDGTSCWHFISLWSHISRGFSNISSLPPINVEPRWLPKDTNFPIHLPFASIDELFVERYVPDPLLRQRLFHFTPEKIAKLKAQANSGNHTSVSAVQAVLAHVWLAVTRARNLHPNDSVSNQLAISTRHRLDPHLHNGYFGNSIQFSVATVNARDLLEKGISSGALLLKQAVETCNNAEIRRGWESWVRKPMLPSIFDSISPTNLSVLGSTRFDLYGTQFGWGPPLASRSGSNFMYEGKITTDPGPVEGIITITICLPFEILRVLENDVEFMESACTVLPPQYCTRTTTSLSNL